MFVCAAQAQSLATIVLENVTSGNDRNNTVYGRVEVVDTNLTREEAIKLFTVGTPKDETDTILAKMIASRVSIPSSTITGRDAKTGKEVNATVVDILMTNINKGAMERLTVGGAEGSFTTYDGQIATVKLGAIRVDSLNFAIPGQALKDGDTILGIFRPSKIVWQDIEVTGPVQGVAATAPGGNLIKIRLGSMAFDATYDGDIPLKVAGSIVNLLIEQPKASEGGQALASIGYDKLDLGITFTGTYDPASKAYTLSDFTLRGVDAGSLSVKAQLDGIERAMFLGSQPARMDAFSRAGISSLELRFINDALVEKVFNYAAKRQGKWTETVRQEASAMAIKVIPYLLGGDVTSLRAAETVSRFILDPKRLTVTATAKNGSLGITELMNIRSPDLLSRKVDVQVTSDDAP